MERRGNIIFPSHEEMKNLGLPTFFGVSSTEEVMKWLENTAILNLAKSEYLTAKSFSTSDRGMGMQLANTASRQKAAALELANLTGDFLADQIAAEAMNFLSPDDD